MKLGLMLSTLAIMLVMGLGLVNAVPYKEGYNLCTGTCGSGLLYREHIGYNLAEYVLTPNIEMEKGYSADKEEVPTICGMEGCYAINSRLGKAIAARNEIAY